MYAQCFQRRCLDPDEDQPFLLLDDEFDRDGAVLTQVVMFTMHITPAKQFNVEPVLGQRQAVITGCAYACLRDNTCK